MCVSAFIDTFCGIGINTRVESGGASSSLG